MILTLLRASHSIGAYMALLGMRVLGTMRVSPSSTPACSHYYLTLKNRELVSLPEHEIRALRIEAQNIITGMAFCVLLNYWT